METLSLGFGLVYAGNLLYSEVLVAENSYQVLFNSQLMGEIAYDENFRWLLISGRLLPQSTVDEIGDRIENWFQ
ncbi:hypothetical protein [Mucilaginibacter psychrotolerans]|uniref:DUF4367 domain-containing protein n=1 Tax=Mucilaginibacter psychrotolerans TaxID=1524096 RepID=A0A4Y8S5U8_9SPHI|nr:hypothetical protein [Mucilaginibacter psychrotolerans]TFF34373.1 hypothetical protein E2R66_22120 [Mucilaginibacter psychrotolerans]